MHKDFRSDVLFTVAVIIGLILAYEVKNVLMIVYVSALFAVVLSPALDQIRRIRIGKFQPGRGLAIIILLVGVLGSIALFVTFAAPPIYRDIKDLVTHFPERTAGVVDRVRHWPFMSDFDVSQLKGYIDNVLGGAFGFFKGVAGGLFGFFSWFIITSYFILDGERAFYWALSMFPQPNRDRLERTMIRAEKRMRHWLVGQLALMFIIGISSAVTFGLLGIKYFYALAVLAGLANIIPIIGPIVAVTVASIVALFDDPAKFIGVIAFFIVYQQIETAFLQPRIMKTTVDLPPLAVIISLSLGGSLAGVLGALVAVPTAALCAVLIDEYLVKKDAKYPAGLEEEVVST